MKHFNSTVNNPMPPTAGAGMQTWPALRVLLLCLVLMAGAAAPARASHFRFGSLTWRTVSDDLSKRTIEFKVSRAYRRSSTAFADVTVGSTVPAETLTFGDGASSNITLTVTSVDIAGGVFYGEATITHKYSAVGDYLAFFTDCCRLSSLVNNANGTWFVSSVVNVGSGNNSPVSTLSPVVNVAIGQNPAQFVLPASDPDGDQLTFSLATLADFNGYACTNAPGLTVNATTGLVSFDTSGATAGQLFNAVIKISDGHTSILVDFLINTTARSTAPVFDYSVTPPNGYVYKLAPGQKLSFSVRATDSDPGDVVNLQAFGLPLASTTAPALPISGNPVQTAFSWTPTAANLGTTIVTFVARDLAGVQASTSVTIEVTTRPVFDVPPTPADRSVVQTTPGTALSYAIQASSPNPAGRVSIVSATGLPAGGSYAPALPTPAANPTRTQLNWTPALADWGPHAVIFTARDASSQQATHTLNFVINSAPAFTSLPTGLTLTVGQPFRYNVTATDPDLPYGDRLALLASVLPAWLTLVDNGNGTATLSGTPTAAQVGSHPVTLEAEDLYHHGNSFGPVTQSFVVRVVGCTTRLAAVGTNPACAGTNSGRIALSVTGATAPVTYAWAGPNGYRSTAQNPTELGPGTYSVTVTDANRCTATAQATLVAPAPTAPPTVGVTLANPVYAQQPTTIFLGYGPQTATLTAAGGVSYVWRPATGLSDPTIANPVFTPTAAGSYTYTVTALNAAGCPSSASVTLRVVEARCGNNPRNPKVLVCHNGHEICISPNAVPAHIGPGSTHNDYLGSCVGVPLTPRQPAVASAKPKAAPAREEVVLEAFPNPLTSATAVRFRAPVTAAASVRVYDQMGTLVATLFDGVAESGRDYSLALNASRWPTGIYLCHFVGLGQTRTQRLMVAR